MKGRGVPLVAFMHLALARVPGESLGCTVGGITHLVLTRMPGES